MTELLDPPRVPRPSDPSGPGGPGGRTRSLAVGAAVAGTAAALLVLLGCMAVALAGWFASDAGELGSTRTALRVGTDGWLLAQGVHLHLAAGAVTAGITMTPLGLTLLCAFVAHRLGRWAAATSVVEDARGLLSGVVLMAGAYGLVAVVAATLASTDSAELGLVGSFAGSFVVALLAGGTGLLRGARDVVDWRTWVPPVVRSVTTGAVSAVLALVAAASLLLAGALLADLGTAANVLSRLHADVSGGLLYTLLVAAVVPNAVLLTGAYLLGPGFALGTGTLVSPTAVTLGPVPAFPLLAALPGTGSQPAWLAALVALPVVAAVVGVLVMLRRQPATGYGSGALRGVAAGVGGGLLLTLLVLLAGGAVGPGRMSDIGAPLLATLVSASLAMGIGGLAAGLAGTWWARRR